QTVTLFLNIFGCLAWFYIDATRGVDFGLSILWFLLFTPCSFVCWYRPLYGAFRPLYGAFSGWISSLASLNKSIPVGIMMAIIAALFTASAVISLVMFKKVHGLYRTTGASFEKAQQEFSTGVMSNKTVQTAGANSAATAVTSAAQNVFKGKDLGSIFFFVRNVFPISVINGVDRDVEGKEQQYKKNISPNLIQIQRLSLGKCRDTEKFWLEGEGLDSAPRFLSCSRSLSLSLSRVGGETAGLLMLWEEFAATTEGVVKNKVHSLKF
ncbi:Secretory carrier-associated membrane protein 1, partial [Lamprotornis superbus]